MKHDTVRAAVAPAGESRAMGGPAREALEFLAGFLRAPACVGSVAPSSRTLESCVVAAADLSRARLVVELGPGTGGTTRALLAAMPADACLMAIELDERFHAALSSRLDDPRLLLQHGSAERLAEYLRARRLGPVDAIVSGIPFSTMPGPVAHATARAIADALAPGGRFVAYQWRAHVARYVGEHLGAPQRRRVWRNLPPMHVFRWVRPGTAGDGWNAPPGPRDPAC